MSADNGWDRCGTTHYAGCPCHEGKRDKRVKELAAEVERLRADQRACRECEHASTTQGARIRDLEAEVEAVRSQCDTCTDKIPLRHEGSDGLIPEERATVRRLRAENDRLREALGAVEHVDHWCPWCHYRQRDGHAPDCARQAALALPLRGSTNVEEGPCSPENWQAT